MPNFRWIAPFSLLAIAALQANPKGPYVVSGNALFSEAASSLQIEASDGAVIHWDDFSIEPSEMTRFIQPGSSACVLNKATGPNLSALLGTLESNGQVYIVNPRGVIIGKDAQIRTAGLFLTTFEIDDFEFAEEREWLLRGGGAIVNWGTIEAQDGDLYLIAEKIENFGALKAPRGAIEIAAAKEVLVRPFSQEKILIRPSKELFSGGIENEGSLEAAKIELRAALNPFGLAINHTGEAEAAGIYEYKGRILLAAEGRVSSSGSLRSSQIHLSGDAVEVLPFSQIDASGTCGGGSISVGDAQTRYVRVDSRALLSADARDQGDGGKIVLWGENVCASEGTFSARGGALGGDGGFIEISGNGLVIPRGEIDTSAPRGDAGLFFIDPSNVVIHSMGDMNLGPFLAPPPPPMPGTNYSFMGNAAILNTNLQTFLATTNVRIDTANGPGGVGDLTVSAPVNWSSGFSLYLVANHDLTVNETIHCSGAGSVFFTAGNLLTVAPVGAGLVEVRTNAGSISAVSGSDFTVGDAAAMASSGIFSTSGPISIQSGGHLLLKGGAMPLAFAEISSIANDVAVVNTAGSLQLTGGSGMHAYAQIGKGNISAPVSITSDIIIGQPPGGNVAGVALTGGSGTGAYAQIGHAPAFLSGGSGSSTAVGDVLFPESGINGALTLIGGAGPGAGASAIIGHGNLLSSELASASGTIRANAQGNILLQSGVTECHAVIGFQNPTAGSSVDFTASSPLVSAIVANPALGTVTLTAGDQSNAVIGYYNNSSMGAHTTSVDITSLTVSANDTQTLQLSAGNASGTQDGAAAIGTLVNFGDADSTVSVSAGDMSVFGPTLGDDGFARIVNQRPGVSSGRSVTLTQYNVLGQIQVLGGTGSTSGFADLYAGGALIANFRGSLFVNNTLQNGYAHILGNTAVNLNPDLSSLFIGLDVEVIGGNNPIAEALIQSLTGPVTLGTTTFDGAQNLTVGDPLSKATSQILASAGVSQMHLATHINVTGGSQAPMPPFPAAFSQISGASSELVLISENGTITLTGGSDTLCFAEIGSTTGDVSISLKLGNLDITGGSATNAYAQLGRGIGNAISSVDSDLLFPFLLGSVTIQGGTAVGAYAQLGHSPYNGMAFTSASGDIQFVTTGILNALTLRGGDAANCTAILGHGNELTSTLGMTSSHIALRTDNQGITVLPGSVAQTNAVIGFANPTGGSFAAFQVSDSSISVTSNGFFGPILVDARGTTGMVTGNNATIGYYNESNGMVPPNVVIDDITVIGMFGNNVELYAANRGATVAGIAAIGTLSNTGTALSNIQISAGTLLLQGPDGPLHMDDGAARVVNSLPGTANPAYDMTASVATLTMLGGVGAITGFADMYSANDLTIRFSQDANINNDPGVVPQLQHGYAQIVAHHTVGVNDSFFGQNLYMTGGANPGAYALIQANTGECLVGGASQGIQNIEIGMANSIAYSKIVAIQALNQVSASLAISLLGGAGLAAQSGSVAWIENTFGPIEVNSGLTLSITGGTGDSATAQIINQNNTITVSSGGDCSLLGGPGPGTESFAQVGTIIGTVEFTSVGGDLNLTGGPAQGSYAQIGIGSNPAAPLINSSLVFDSIVGNVILEDPLLPLPGNDSYAQIGHSPFGGMGAYTAIGDITLTALGNVTLNGSSSDNTSATIGHGNPLTPNLANLSSSISVSSSGINGVFLNPGPGVQAHATIGFFSPFAGSAFSFTCSSGAINVSATNGPVSLIANTNNATIGYYNAATPTLITLGVNSLSIQTNTVPPAPPNQVVLQSGNGGPANGIASIGVFAASMGSMTTVSDLSITTYELDLYGPTAGNNGQALVYNAQPGLAGPNDMSLFATNINVLGGLGLAPGMAAIYSSQSLLAEFNGVFNINLDPNSPATLQPLSATVTAGGDITINPNNDAGDLSVLGGSTMATQSLLNSTGGGIFFGDPTQAFTGVHQLMIGRPDMIGPAGITTTLGTGGDINLFADGPLLVQGGISPGAVAQLSANGALTAIVNGSISLLGGAGAGSNALVGAQTGPFRIISLGTVTLSAPAASMSLFTNQGANSLSHVEALYNISIGENSTFLNGGNGSTFVISQADILLSQNGSIINFGGGKMDVLAGVSIFLSDSSLIQTNGGQMSLVVDNLYPASPGIGSGSFQKSAGSQIASGGGALRIFTARRPQNTITGLINAFPYIPGIEFLNTATEIWGIYYFSALGGLPFTIFYKDFLSVPGVIQSQRFGSNEFLQTIKAYDDLHFRAIPTFYGYRPEARQSSPERALSSFEIVPDLEYGMIRRTYRNYNLKKLDLLR